MDTVEEIKNATEAYLIKHYPQSLSIIPKEVFEFGLPTQLKLLIFGLVNALFLIISLTGNVIVFYLYTNVNTVVVLINPFSTYVFQAFFNTFR